MALLPQNFEKISMIGRDCGDHAILFNANDRTIGNEILERGGWMRSDFDRILATLKEKGKLSGPIFMDVGANIGTQTIYALLSGQFERAFAVEPLPVNVKCLRLNALLNDLDDRI
jgi:hypothetical protein